MKKITTVALILFLPTVAFGNVVWPALYAETKVSSLTIIGLSLVLEYLVIRSLFKRGIRKSIFYTATANIASGLIGLFLRPISGLAWELSLGQLVMWIFDWGTFSPVAWVFVPIIGSAINASLELLTIKAIWKETFTKKNFFSLWLINWVTVGIATLWVVLYPPHM